MVFDAGHPEELEQGGRVYEMRSAERGVRDGEVALRFGRGVDCSRIQVGVKLWKTSDPELERRLRESFDGDAPKFQRPIQVEVYGRVGQPLTIIARDEIGHVAQFASSQTLTRAEKQPLTTERLRGQLGRLGGTPFKLGELNNRLEGEAMLPVSELNRLRRAAVNQLETLRAQPKRWTLNPCGGGCESAADLRATCLSDEKSTALSRAGAASAAELIVLVRRLPQLEAALRCGVQTLYCEFEDPKKYREAVAAFRDWQAQSSQCADQAPLLQSPIANRQSQILVAPPRIFKSGEQWILNQVRSCEADGYLLRNYDHLKFFAEGRRIGDFSLNVANPLSAEYFIRRYSLERVTASYDLNIVQLEALLTAAPPEWFEITIHQHMPLFHMEHCVFCAFLSNGTDFTNCGRPCDKHEVKLRDRVGAEHALKADAGCRNTVFNALAQTGAEFVSRMLALGGRAFRIEFLNETPDQVAQTIARYRQLLQGEISGAQLWRELKLLNQLGVTRGQLA